MKEAIIEMLKSMIEYSEVNQNGNCGGFDIDYVEEMINMFEKEN